MDRQLKTLLPSSLRKSTVNITAETSNYKIQCTYVSLTLTISEQKLFVPKPYFRYNTKIPCEDHIMSCTSVNFDIPRAYTSPTPFAHTHGLWML
jgi:hypothetical protein